MVIHARNGYFALAPEARIQGLRIFEMPLLKAFSDGKMSDDVSFQSGTVLLRPPKTDPQGRQGRRVKRTGDNEVRAKEMSAGSRAVVLLNGGSPETRIPYSGPTSDTPPNWVPRFAICGSTKISIMQRVISQRPCPVTAWRCS
jgi:hypothetical protein